MKYLALAVVAFAAGAEMGLTKDQAGARRHALTEHPKRKGWFIASGPVQLKAGEEFQYDGDLPKGMADALEPQKSKPSKAEAIAVAEKALAEAQAALAAATDDAKPAAQKAADEAAAALQALKA